MKTKTIAEYAEHERPALRLTEKAYKVIVPARRIRSYQLTEKGLRALEMKDQS